MFLFKNFIYNNFKTFNSLNKSLRFKSVNPDRFLSDSFIVHNFVKKLSFLFEEDRHRLQKILYDYEFTQLQNIYNFGKSISQTENEIEQLKSIVTDNCNDKEMMNMFEKEIQDLSYNLEESKKKAVIEQEVMVEMHAGVGGQEAMLFTKEILQMYQKHILFKGWQSELISSEHSDLGGLKHASLSVRGLNAYKRLRFEGGVHRVQRTPATEKAGRLHTSAMSVAVILQPSEVEVELKAADLRTETCRSSGKGGQHVNTTDSAVRIVHLPTGIAAECQKERSQIKNKETALKMLRSRIYEKFNDEVVQKYSACRKLQMGSGGRNEKVRTYNFKDDRVTDHRIGTSFFGLSDFFEGTHKLDEMIDALEDTYKTELLFEKINHFLETS